MYRSNQKGFAVLTFLVVIAAVVPILIVAMRTKSDQTTAVRNQLRTDIASLELIEVVAQAVQRNFQRGRAGLCVPGSNGLCGPSYPGGSGGGVEGGSSGSGECFPHPMYPDRRLCLFQQIQITERSEEPTQWYVRGEFPWFILPRAQADILLEWTTHPLVAAAPVNAMSWSAPAIPSCGSAGMRCYTLRLCMLTRGCSNNEYVHQQIGIITP